MITILALIKQALFSFPNIQKLSYQYIQTRSSDKCREYTITKPSHNAEIHCIYALSPLRNRWVSATAKGNQHPRPIYYYVSITLESARRVGNNLGNIIRGMGKWFNWGDILLYYLLFLSRQTDTMHCIGMVS